MSPEPYVSNSETEHTRVIPRSAMTTVGAVNAASTDAPNKSGIMSADVVRVCGDADNGIASEPLMEALAVAARRLWARAGGERASAKSFWATSTKSRRILHRRLGVWPSHGITAFTTTRSDAKCGFSGASTSPAA